MDNKFRWDMFITSFLPLWLSILIDDMWNILQVGINGWCCNKSYLENLKFILQETIVYVVVVIIVCIVMITSMCSINSFLKDKYSISSPPCTKVNHAVRANNLASEFLIAYILPMIAFDFSELKSVILFAIYFGMLALLCIRNGNVYANIWLEFKGYRMYICELERYILGKTYKYNDCLVISKQNLTSMTGKNIKYWDFENYIYIDLS